MSKKKQLETDWAAWSAVGVMVTFCLIFLLLVLELT